MVRKAAYGRESRLRREGKEQAAADLAKPPGETAQHKCWQLKPAVKPPGTTATLFNSTFNPYRSTSCVTQQELGATLTPTPRVTDEDLRAKPCDVYLICRARVCVTRRINCLRHVAYTLQRSTMHYRAVGARDMGLAISEAFARWHAS